MCATKQTRLDNFSFLVLSSKKSNTVPCAAGVKLVKIPPISKYDIQVVFITEHHAHSVNWRYGVTPLGWSVVSCRIPPPTNQQRNIVLICTTRGLCNSVILEARVEWVMKEKGEVVFSCRCLVPYWASLCAYYHAFTLVSCQLYCHYQVASIAQVGIWIKMWFMSQQAINSDHGNASCRHGPNKSFISHNCTK